MMPRLRFLGGLLWRIVSLAGMAAIAFGWDKSAWKRSGVFVLLSMALGGASLSVGRGNFLTLLLTAAGVWALCIVAFGGRVGGREYVPVELTYGGKTVSIVALRDSGNTLRDPISGEQVLVVSGEVAEKLTGLTQDQLRAPLKTLVCRPVPGLRLIPYRAVGQALMGYSGFNEYGLNILAAFDASPKAEKTEEGKPIYHISQLAHFCRTHKVLMGIITVPAEAAQQVADQLIAGGIKGIWNFAPTHLDVPSNILVQYENMATSLAVLSVHLQAQIKEEKEVRK